LPLVALVLAFVVSGAPAWIGELVEDDCAEECADSTGCPEDGCADCSILCTSCPRTHGVAPHAAALAPAARGLAWLAGDARERVPDDPVPEGVFHPPRRAS
jgi:hypothetical protein